MKGAVKQPLYGCVTYWKMIKHYPSCSLSFKPHRTGLYNQRYSNRDHPICSHCEVYIVQSILSLLR
uniref:Uncharacterized protein n=1 Tax=Octopus bimaculoides TaxID=37653 RepID=A0A0L8IEC4_OCTBM